AVDDNDVAIDLATGERALVVVGSAGGVSDQMRWTERCQLLHALDHRAIAPLVDFGLVGENSRFEAWACGGPWRGSADEADVVRARAARFLRAMCLTATDSARDRIRASREGTGAWVPDAGSGYPRIDGGPGDELPIADRGVRLVQRRALSALAEMF